MQDEAVEVRAGLHCCNHLLTLWMVHNLYVEAEPIIRAYYPKGINWYYLCGGRGIGKTYGALHFCYLLSTGQIDIFNSSEARKFLYLRRTAVEAQSVAALESCPYKKYNREEGTDVAADYNTKLGFGNFYTTVDKSEHIGYIAALSTFANLRGIDFSDVIFILYDECIPESKKKAPLHNEGDLLLNVVETINRNRVIEGKPEVVVMLLSNPIDLASPLLAQIGLTSIIMQMIFKNRQKYTDYNRSLHIERYKDHIVSKKKEDSMLYRFSGNLAFKDRSLSGDFKDNDLSVVRTNVNYNEYTPIFTIGEMSMYRHKSRMQEFHLSQKTAKAKYMFRTEDADRLRELFFYRYKLLVLERNITYDDYVTKVVFESLIKYKPYQF